MITGLFVILFVAVSMLATVMAIGTIFLMRVLTDITDEINTLASVILVINNTVFEKDVSPYER
jgi:hypothetical protein